MKNKGRRFKRANDALKKIHLDYDNPKGYVISTSKNNPYFTARLWDRWDNEWKIVHCCYISRCDDLYGNFIPY